MFSCAVRRVILVCLSALAVLGAGCSGNEKLILAFRPGPVDQIVAGAVWPAFTIQVLDLRGDPVPVTGVDVTVTITPSNIDVCDDVTGDQTEFGTFTRTLSGGVVTFDDISYTRAHTITIDVTAPAIRGLFQREIEVLPDIPDHTVVQGPLASPQTAGAVWPAFQVCVADVFENRVPTTRPVTVAVSDDEADVIDALDGTVTRDTALGLAVFDDISYTVSGDTFITAVSGALQNARPEPITIDPDAPDHLSFDVQPTDVSVDDRQTIAVSIRDQFDNIIRAPFAGNDEDVAVTIGNNPGGGSLRDGVGAATPQLQATAVDGVAVFTGVDAVQIDRPGSDYNLDAAPVTLAITGDTSNGFDVIAGDPQSVAWQNPPRDAGSGSQTAGQPWVSDIGGTVVALVLDQFGNVTGPNDTTVVTINDVGGGSTANGGFQSNSETVTAGVATFTNLSYLTDTNLTVRATAIGLISSPTVNVNVDHAGPDRIVITTQPTSNFSGNPTTTDTAQVVVAEVRDAFGNLVLNAAGDVDLTFSINAAGNAQFADVGGTVLTAPPNPRATPAGGVATFNVVRVTRPGNGYVLAATGGGAANGAVSVPFNVIHGEAVQMAFQTVPADLIADEAQSATVEIQDFFGNRVISGADAAAQVTLTLNDPGLGIQPASLRDLNANPVASIALLASNGLVTFPHVQVDIAQAGYTLEATATLGAPPAVANTTSLPFDITNGFPAVTAFSDVPNGFNGNPAAQIPVTTPFTVQVIVMDQFGNRNALPPGSNTRVNLSIGANGGSPLAGTCVQGCSTLQASGGIVTFPNVQINRPGTGYTFIATPVFPTIETSESDPFEMQTGAPTKLIFTEAPRLFETAGLPWAPFKVAIADTFDNVISSGSNDDLSINTSVTLQGATVTGVPTVNGEATFADVRYTVAEDVVFTVENDGVGNVGGAGALSTASFTVTVQAGQARDLLFEDAGQFDPVTTGPMTAGVAFPPFTVTIVDAFGNQVEDSLPITLDVVSGNGALSDDEPVGGLVLAPLIRQADLGVATFGNGTAGIIYDRANTDDAPGALTLRARTTSGDLFSNLVSPTITVTHGPRDHLDFRQEPVSTDAVTSVPVKIALEDAFDNTVTDPFAQVSVSLTVLDAATLTVTPAGWVNLNATTDSSGGVDAGTASFNVLVEEVGQWVVQVSTGTGLPGGTTVTSAPFTVINGPLAALQIASPPGVDGGAPLPSGGALDTVDDVMTLQVQLVDGTPAANPVISGPTAGTTLVLSIAGGPAGASCVSGCGVPVAPDAGGLVTFTGVQVDTPGAYQFEATTFGGAIASPLTPMPALNLAAGVPGQLAFAVSPSSFEQAGELWDPFIVEVQDQFGNPTNSGTPGTDTVQLIGNPDLGSMTGTTSIVGLDINDQAVFNDLIDNAAETLRFRAVAGGTIAGITDTQEVQVRVQPGQPADIQVVGGLPYPDQASTVPWDTDIVGEIQDAFGNTVFTALPVTLELVGGTGTLSPTAPGSLTQSTNPVLGEVTFPANNFASYDVAETVTVRLVSGLIGSAPFSLNVLPGAAAALAFVGQPQDETTGVAQTVEVAIVDAAGNPIAAAGDSIQLLSTPAAYGPQVNPTGNAGTNGVARFSVSINPPASGYTLTATCTAGANCGATVPVVSDPFDVLTGTLAYNAAPLSSVTAGSVITTDGTNPVRVGLRDENGAPVTSGSDTVTAQLGSYEGGVIYIAEAVADDELLEFDPDVPSLSSIGNIGFQIFTMTWRRSTSTLYGIAAFDGAGCTASACLVTIDRATGAGALVGDLETGGTPREITGATFVGNTLVGITSPADPVSPRSIVTIALAGNPTAVTDTGIAIPGVGLQGVGYDLATNTIIVVESDDSIPVKILDPITYEILDTLALQGGGDPVSGGAFVEGQSQIIRFPGGVPTLSAVEPDGTLTDLADLSAMAGGSADVFSMAWAHAPLGVPQNLSGTLVRTTLSQAATFNNLSYPVAGSYTIAFTSNRHGTLGFTPIAGLTGAPDHLAFSGGPAAVETAGQSWSAFEVRIEDAAGNLVDLNNVIVTLDQIGGLATNGGFSGHTALTSGGVASFGAVTYDTAEVIDVGASANLGGLLLQEDVRATVTVDSGPFAAYDATYSADPVAAGTPVDVTIVALDAFGNIDTANFDLVDILSSTDTGANASLPIPVALANGVAVAPVALAYTELGAQTVDLQLSGGGPIDTSSPLTVEAGPVASFDVQFSAPSTAAGAPLTVTVTAIDGFGNPVASYGGAVIFTGSTDAGAVLPAGPQSLAGGTLTLAGGVTFFDAAGSPHTVDVEEDVSGNFPSTSAAVAVTPAAATAVIFGTAPASPQVTDVVWAPFDVRIEDAFGNLVNAGVNVTLQTLPGATGTLGGTTTLLTVGGTASFNDIFYDTPEVIDVEVVSPGLTSTAPVSVTVGNNPPTLSFVPPAVQCAPAAALAETPVSDDGDGSVQSLAFSLLGTTCGFAVAVNPGTGEVTGTCALPAVPCTVDVEVDDGNAATAAQLAVNVVNNVWYVDGGGNDTTGDSWANAFTTLDGATAAAASGDQIWVAQGTYRAAAPNLPVLVMVDEVSVYGGFEGLAGAMETSPAERPNDPLSNPTILDGDQDLSGTFTADDSVHVVVGASDAIFDGFIVQNGNADGADGGAGVPAPLDAGAGMFNIAIGGLVVENAAINSNSATNFGGGVYNSNTTSSLMFSNVTFEGNLADNGGGMYGLFASAELVNTTFRGNVAPFFGGGIFNFDTALTITNVVFEGNFAALSAGGIYTNAPFVLTHGAFDGNTAAGPGGAVFVDGGFAALTDVSFRNNAADTDGGALYVIGASPVLTNASFMNNVADDDDSGTGNGGAVFAIGGPATTTVTNGAFYGNIDRNSGSPILSEVVGSAGATVTVDASCGESVLPGADNILLDGTSTPTLSFANPFTVLDLIGEGAGDPAVPDGVPELYLRHTGVMGSLRTSACVDAGDSATADAAFAPDDWRDRTTSADGATETDQDGAGTETVDAGRHYLP